jgi:hypothetical protein
MEVKYMSSTALNECYSKDAEFLADSQGITQSEAIRKAIGTECYIRQEISEGSKFFILKSDGRSLEVVFQ